MQFSRAAMIAAAVLSAAGALAPCSSRGAVTALSGVVVGIADGDTLTLLDAEGEKRVIRLTDIDAPETGHGRSRPGQPFSRTARDYLRDAAQGRQATAECFDIDRRYARERYVCRVHVDGRDLSMSMLDAGLAMVQRVNRRYVRDAGSYRREELARSEGRGLWRQPDPVPPWQWRRTCWEQQQCTGAGD